MTVGKDMSTLVFDNSAEALYVISLLERGELYDMEHKEDTYDFLEVMVMDQAYEFLSLIESYLAIRETAEENKDQCKNLREKLECLDLGYIRCIEDETNSPEDIELLLKDLKTNAERRRREYVREKLSLLIERVDE